LLRLAWLRLVDRLAEAAGRLLDRDDMLRLDEADGRLIDRDDILLRFDEAAGRLLDLPAERFEEPADRLPPAWAPLAACKVAANTDTRIATVASFTPLRF
jgi:hypothetical protein